ncbi:MAG: hypothetical protein ACYCU8_00935 [Ferrimicrobium acidiphilum]
MITVTSHEACYDQSEIDRVATAFEQATSQQLVKLGQRYLNYQTPESTRTSWCSRLEVTRFNTEDAYQPIYDAWSKLADTVVGYMDDRRTMSVALAAALDMASAIVLTNYLTEKEYEDLIAPFQLTFGLDGF